ncbi:ABC transporter substrate-binding protein [Aureimonas sp. SA4125]|uniref:ABC transporter substrate-binding protein n=1 Tax=Aureimonas sp. SA4125 TaxID=2826993 RepID=UPI001CC45DA2|nr:ABC transporter substrate-binding protein [Aureimonas sp. SA4125]
MKTAPQGNGPAPRAGQSRRTILAGLAAGLVCGLPSSAAAGEDGLRFVHAYGETVLPRPATRVVSLGYTTHDTLLALGQPPLAIRYWYGDHAFGVWPWAQPFLNGAEPVLLSGEVSMEKVAALAPDLIVAIGAGISKAEYAVLSRIAPVLVHDGRYSGYGTPWDVMALTLGRALGRSDRAEELVAATREAFGAARARNPLWAGKTGVAAYHTGGETGAFTGADTRARFLADLGFRLTRGISALSGPDGFYVPLSPEDLSPLDADVLVWMSGLEQVPDLVGLPMRRTLKAHREGREVMAGPLVSGAMSHGSVLSLPFALRALEADLAAAADGDLDTPVASAEAAGLVPGRVP